METKFIPTPTGRFHAKVTGSGAAVVLVHGYGEHNSWKTWEKNVAALAEHFTVYALDMLGYGESQKFAPRLPDETHARSLLELLDAEKIARASLVGLSWGGEICMRAVTLAPTRVTKLVLVDSAGAKRAATDYAIACPTLIVWDQDDAVIPAANAQILANAIKNSPVVIFTRGQRDPDADPENKHWSQMTHAREWNRAVSEFLRGG
jgi:pimeloyl-ACP methyl ester carboxylesterase